MKIDFFQRAVLFGLAYILKDGDQSLKTRTGNATAHVLLKAARSGELPDIDKAVDEYLIKERDEAVARMQGRA